MRCQDVTLTYPCGKKNASTVKVLQGITMSGHNTLLQEPNATDSDLKDTGTEFFLAMYGQKEAKSTNNVRYQIYRWRKKPLELKKLPPTDVNVMLHILHAGHVVEGCRSEEATCRGQRHHYIRVGGS